MPDQLAMPSPRRAVLRALGLCQRLGYERAQALQAITLACDRVIERYSGTDTINLDWINAVRNEARCRLKEQ